MNSTVLLPVKNHAPWARNVAEVVTNVENGDTEAVVLHIFDEDQMALARADLDDTDTPSVDNLASRTAGVDAAVAVLTDGGFDVTPRGVREDDRTADVILNVAESVGADRIYLYGRQRSPAGKAVFGSTVQWVILNSTVPVTIVPAGSA